MIKINNRRPSLGRRKIEMKLIEDEDARHVCFSKRRNGIFKKANELSILCGAEVAVVVFSPAGKPYSFGHPSVSEVAERLLSGDNHQPPLQQQPPQLAADVHGLSSRIEELSAMLVAERKKKRELEEAVLMARAGADAYLWDANVEELGLPDQARMMAMLERLQGDARSRVSQQLMESYGRSSASGIALMENVMMAPSASSCYGLGFF